MLLHLQLQPRWITALTVLPFSDVIVSGSWDGSLRAFQISADRRRIERLGVVGTADLAVGVVNDIAIAEKGDRGREGLYVAAALGREHRLGRWSTHEGKNGGILFDIPRKAKSTLTAAGEDE
ncbi:hypothetical protein MRB53_040163 [Persea americana]|nr:hypothetical protein MRB53_040163 [Persea americana]